MIKSKILSVCQLKNNIENKYNYKYMWVNIWFTRIASRTLEFHNHGSWNTGCITTQRHIQFVVDIFAGTQKLLSDSHVIFN